MKVVKVKRIPEINKSYYKVTKMFCDKCKQEIKESEEYLEVCYSKNRRDGELKYKHFCFKCAKDSMYNMFLNNDFTDFDRWTFLKDKEWEELEEDEAKYYGFKEEN